MGRREEISAESRQRLLDAAHELCAEVGVRNASVGAIAIRAGISRGSIAWHFGSKDGLINAVIEEAFRRAAEQLTASLHETRIPSIETMLRSQLALANSPEGQIFATVLPEALAADDALTHAYGDGYQRIRTVYAEYITEHDLAPKGIKAEHLATALFGVALGLNVQDRIDPRRVNRAKALHALRAMPSA